MEKKIILWGYTAVGKTSLLATYFNYESLDQRKWIKEDLDIYEHNDLKSLQRVMQRLRLSQHTKATVSTKESVYNIPTKHNGIVSFTDVKGEATNRPDDDELKAFKDSDAILCFMEWPTPENYNIQLGVIEFMRPFFNNRPCGLVITKAEQHMTKDDNRWQGGAKWLKFNNQWNQATSKFFGNNFWPATAFGYSQIADGIGCFDGHPACIRNEFGDYMPYFDRRDEQFVQDVVSRPFNTILEKLGVLN